jgi:N-acetylglucosaminyl-diphospho-decaprenol L-rhamnosyltransferase
MTDERGPTLAVIIVSFNVRELLRACLTATYRSLARGSQLTAQVWVVDNASADGSADMVIAEFPHVRVLTAGSNLGFAGGNNLVLQKLGFARSRALGGAKPPVPCGVEATQASVPDFVLLLNPDAEPESDAIEEMVRFLRGHPHVGGVGAQLRYPDGGFQHGAYRFPDLWQLWFDLFPPRPRRLLESRLNGRYARKLYEKGNPFPIDFALGAALMVRREAIVAAGLLDEGYFMYAEEVDWCWRMQRAGWPLCCVPAAHVIHHGGASTRQFRSSSFVNLWRSRFRLYEKFYGPVRRRIAARMVELGMRAEEYRARTAAARGQISDQEMGHRISAARQIAALFNGSSPGGVKA